MEMRPNTTKTSTAEEQDTLKKMESHGTGYMFDHDKDFMYQPLMTVHCSTDHHPKTQINLPATELCCEMTGHYQKRPV